MEYGQSNDEITVADINGNTQEPLAESAAVGQDSFDGNTDINTGEKRADTPESQIGEAVYERRDWQDKVDRFFCDYPIAKDFAAMIGEQIASDEALSKDGDCLEKALAKVFAKVYVLPEKLVEDDDFVEKYVYGNEKIRGAIVEKYLEELEQNQPPRSISSRGSIALTPPDRPKSIADAGRVIQAMLDNRRI